MTASATRQTSSTSDRPPQAYFRHPTGPGTGARPRAATRYLCGAVYLDDGFADKAIEELVEDEHRAVAPSMDFDAYEVLRHCFRLRRLTLVRDTVITALLLIGLSTAPVFTAAWIVVGGLAGAAIRFDWRRRSPWKTVIGYVVFGFLLMVAWIFSVTPAAFEVAYVDPLVLLSLDFLLELAGRATSSPPLLLAILTVLTLTAFRMVVYAILTIELAPGRPHAPAQDRYRRALSVNQRVARRAAQVGTAQWGNITLHGGYSPFVGSGGVKHAWSICVELDRVASAPGQSAGVGASPELDPVELHAAVRDRLYSLRDERLPESERISGLDIYDHVIAAGDRVHADPLIDPASGVPYAEASPDAIAAIIRHPQGSLRYYQRIVVGAEGKPVRSKDGSLVTPAQDQEIIVSAFVYLAIEGGMLYAEFVSTVLSPVREQFHLIDRLPAASGLQLAGRAVVDSVGYLAAGSIGAPFRLLDVGWQMFMLTRRMRKADRASREYLTYGRGARCSLRELVALEKPETYLQELDVQKYTKLIERRLTNAVLDFLDERQIDTGEYRARMNVIHNNGVMITGGIVVGAIAAGPGATANDRPPGPSA